MSRRSLMCIRLQKPNSAGPAHSVNGGLTLMASPAPAGAAAGCFLGCGFRPRPFFLGGCCCCSSADSSDPTPPAAAPSAPLPSPLPAAAVAPSAIAAPLVFAEAARGADAAVGAKSNQSRNCWQSWVAVRCGAMREGRRVVQG